MIVIYIYVNVRNEDGCKKLFFPFAVNELIVNSNGVQITFSTGDFVGLIKSQSSFRKCHKQNKKVDRSNDFSGLVLMSAGIQVEIEKKLSSGSKKFSV